MWQQMRDDPQYAPEHLALAAVRRLGPQAARWAAESRRQYPAATPDALAQWAIQRFTNHARLSGAVSGATGLPGAVLDVGVLAWTQARLVLHLAAAHGHDPTHPDRATDLLVLQKVHAIAQHARSALAVAAGRERAGAALARAGGGSAAGAAVRVGVALARMAGLRAAKRMFAKVVPFAGVILGTWANSAATTDLARRATLHFRRPGPAALPGPGGAG
ncbi:EcsC family protein [Pilimelia anulata]|uniref:EcsC family protein n=1 Tax=Pilimelia anulata TaxID=53371 RepID=UPI001E3EC19D|nr:EcsC family protein [Pilimelia anulata]